MVALLHLVLLGLPISSLAITANPIRRVISLLDHMQSKVEEEGKKEAELFEKFQCYCQNGARDLAASITSANSQISHDTSSVAEAQALQTQLVQDLKDHEADRADAKGAIASATALREKEAGVYAKDSSDLQTNIAALGKAIAALEKGSYGSFLQTAAAATLRQLSIEVDMSSTDRDMLSAFLSERHSAGYAPRSGEIIGILKEMKDTMEKNLAEVQGTEKKAIDDFNSLMAAKKAEIAANTAAIETKTVRNGEVGVDIVNLKESLDDTQKALLADQEFLANLDKNCATKKSEYEVRTKTRQEELLALADTIRLLSDDDALELFKKTLPSPALLQMRLDSKDLRQQALRSLKKAAAKRDPRMDLVMLALSGKSKSFENVIKMIDGMTALLAKEQSDDDTKKAYCEADLDAGEDKLKELNQSASGQEQAMEVITNTLAQLKSEIAALVAGIQELDQSVAKATELRKQENADFKSTLAANKAAKDLLGLAKNRLNQFYNPNLYVAPAKIELGAQQRVAVNMGSEAAPVKEATGIAGTGITYLQSGVVLAQVSSHEAPPPAPKTFEGAYQKKGQEHSGVMAMLEMLVSDLDKDTNEATVDEKNAQEEYETFMQDSRDKRAQDSQSVSDKEGEKAELEVRLQDTGNANKATTAEAMATAESIKNLHNDCDWLVSNFEARKAARAGEVDSLAKAKAVLSGSDYALLQKREVRVRLLRGA